MQNKTTRWFQFDPLRGDWPPAVPGVYVFLVPGQVLYVGSGVDIRARVKSHMRSTPSTRRFASWWNCEDLYGKWSPSVRRGDWAMREIRLIRRLRPASNSQHNVTRK